MCPRRYVNLIPLSSSPILIYQSCSNGASKAVVAKLIEANPACVRSRDEHEQRLPLHLAAKWGAAQDVILTIMTYHPEGVYIRDSSGNTPMDYAKDLPSHRKMEVVKVLKQGPLLSAVSKAAMQRAAATESFRNQRPISDTRNLESNEVKAAKAEAEKTYAAVVAKMEAKHKQEIDKLKVSKEESEKELESKYLEQIKEAQKEAASERAAKEALELSYEAHLTALKEEASKQKEEIIVSNKKLEQFNHSDCLSVSTLPLRQKVKSISAELEREWENNSRLTKENEALKETNTRVISELKEQIKTMEGLKTKVLTTSAEVESKEAIIDILKKDIAEKEAKIGELVEAKTALNIELEDQKKVIDATTKRLHTATQEIETKENAIDILKKDIAEKEAKIGELVEAKTAFNSELEDQKKVIENTTLPLHQKIKSISAELEQEWENNRRLTEENEALKETNTRVISELKEHIKTMEGLKTKVLTTSEEVESKEAIINILKKDIAEKEAKIGELVEAKTTLNIELEDQKKVIDATTTRLHTATQEIATKENAIDELKFEISEVEARVIELKQELSDSKREVESRDCILKEKEEIMNALTEKNSEIEEIKSRLQTAAEEILSKASKIIELEARQTVKETYCENLSRELDDLKPKLQSEEERASTLAQNISELTIAKNRLELDLKQTIVDMEDIREQLEEATSDLEIKATKISELEKTITEERKIGDFLSSKLEELRIQYKREEQRANELDEKVQNLEENIAELTIDVANKAEDVDKTKSKMFDLTEELDAKCSKISGLEVLLANEESRCEDLTAEVEEVKTVLETAETQLAGLTKDKTNLEATKATLEAELEEKTGKLREIEANLDMVMEERQAKITENMTLEGLLSDKYAEIESLNAEIAEKTAEAEMAVELEKELRKTSSDLLAARTRGNELRGDIAQLNSKLSAANMEIKKYQTRAKTVERWVSSFALSVQGWRLEGISKDKDELLILDSSSAADICDEIDEL
jgi:myosin protein heavy chain/myosin heavy chain 6/7